MVTMPHALKNVKDYFRTYIPDTLILDACTEAGYHWRERQLGLVVTTYLFLQQILHGNTACTHLGNRLHPIVIREAQPMVLRTRQEETRSIFQAGHKELIQALQVSGSPGRLG